MKIKPPVIVILLVASFIVSSCDKDDDVITTQNPEQILTSAAWRLDEIRFLQNNTAYYYKRGVTGNALSFDTESIKFNTDKTGTYTAGGVNYTMTWDFVDAAKTQIRYTINYSTPLVVNWENLVYTETSIKYTEYYTRNGSNSLGVGTRIH